VYDVGVVAADEDVGGVVPGVVFGRVAPVIRPLAGEGVGATLFPVCVMPAASVPDGNPICGEVDVSA
jgi:hypothetical protein